MSIEIKNSTLVAVSDPENQDRFMGYFIHVLFRSEDVVYKLKLDKLIPREGSEEDPHQVIIDYSLDSEVYLKGLKSYLTQTIDLSALSMPKPLREGETFIVEQPQVIEIYLKEKEKENDALKAKSIVKSGNIVSLSKGEIGKTTV